MICHHSKCIFVHIPKTAGTSIERVFLKKLGLSRETRIPLTLGDNFMPQRDPPHFEHLKASQYVKEKFIPQEMYDRYFTFSFVRNPWDRMVSFYKFFSYGRKCDFKSFVMNSFLDELFLNNFSWLFAPQANFICKGNGSLLVDFVGRFENLQEDFQKVCAHLGWPETSVPLVNESKKFTPPPLLVKRIINLSKQMKFKQLRNEISYKWSRSQTSHYDTYQEYFDKESIEFVEHIYKRDIKIFGYSFEK